MCIDGSFIFEVDATRSKDMYVSSHEEEENNEEQYDNSEDLDHEPSI